MNFWLKLKPAASKKWLHLSAGLMWSAVGLYLISLTFDWLDHPISQGTAITMAAIGTLLAITINTFGFSKFAKKNICRIDELKSEKPCIFAFQEWTSYPLVAFMISLGIFLRVYSPIPKIYMAAMYIGIGGSLFLASLHYYYRVCTRNQGEYRGSPKISSHQG